MKHLVLAACLGALTLTSTGAALAQEPAKKPAATKKATSKKSTKKTTEAAAPVEPKGEKWQCELGHSIYLNGNLLRDEVIGLNWEGKEYKLQRQNTVTGADRYLDARSGMDLVVIPSKAMLLNRNLGERLADECQTAAMQAGGAAPTQAGALRAPVATPLLMAPSQPAAQPAADGQPAAQAPKQ